MAYWHELEIELKTILVHFFMGEGWGGGGRGAFQLPVFPRIIAVPRIIVPPVTFDGNIINNRPPPHPSRHLLFLLSPPFHFEVESGPAKLISDDSSAEN